MTTPESVTPARIAAVSLAKATADRDAGACMALIESCDADVAQALIAESSALLATRAQALYLDINDAVTVQDPVLAAALAQLTVGLEALRYDVNGGTGPLSKTFADLLAGAEERTL